MKKQADIDWGMVAKLFAGGALTGAGVGAGTSLVRYLQTLNDKANQQKDTAYDDDVLYINLPRKDQPMANRRAPTGPKYASTNTVGTFTTGTMAGLLGTYMAYNAIRNMYQKHRKQQLQDELDRAQNVYLGGLTDSSQLQKNAAQFSTLTKGFGTAHLALLLSAVGSGIVANRMLQKFFPPIQRPGGDRPRKIVVRSQNTGAEQVTEPEEVTPDAVESTVRTALSNPKIASADCGIADLVAAAAQGRSEEIRDNLYLGVDFMFDSVKGARHQKVSGLSRNLAVSWVSADPMVSAAISPVVASEIHEMSPGLFKLASHVSREFHDDLVGMVGASACEVRRAIYAKISSKLPVFPEKSAGAAAAIIGSDILQALLLNSSMHSALGDNGSRGQNQGQDTSRNRTPGHTNTPISKDSPDMARYNKGVTQFEIEDDDAKQFMDKNGPAIDSALRKM